MDPETAALSTETTDAGEPGRPWVRNPDLWASLLLVSLGILFFADLLFTAKNFYFRDILNFHYPLRKVLIDSYARGEFPLWNPYIYLGQPMLANPNYMAFYPTNLFHLFLPFNYAFKLHFIIHPILAGVGVYFLQRRLGIAPLACLGGSVVYEFSGVVLSFLNLYNFVPAVALLPWIGWAFLAALQTPTRRRVLLFGLLLALQILCMDVFIALGDVLLLTGLAAIDLLSHPHRGRRLKVTLGVGLIGGVFAAGLGAVQILPTLELVPRSVRGAGYDFASVTQWSMHPMDFANILIPNFFGNPYTIGLRGYWGEAFHSGREGYLVSFFVGIGACLVAVLSFFTERRRIQLTVLLIALLGALIALGRFNPAWEWLYQYVPIFRAGRYPVKFALPSALAFALLVSLGLEVLGTALERRGRHGRLVTIFGVACLAIGACLWAYAVHSPGAAGYFLEVISANLLPDLAQAKNLSSISAQLAAGLRWGGTFSALLGLVVLVSPALRRPNAIAALIVFSVCAEILPQNLRLVPLLSDADMSDVPDVNAYLSQLEGQPFRVMAAEGPDMAYRLFAPNDSIAWTSLFARRVGLPFYGMMNRIQYSLYVPVDGLTTMESHQLFQAFRTTGGFENPELLPRINARYAVTVSPVTAPAARLEATYDTGSDLKLRVYRLDGALDRAYFVPGARTAASPEEALRSLLDARFPIRECAVVEAGAPSVREGAHASGEAKVVEYASHSVSCETNSSVPGYLVLLDSYYPGWVGYVDGHRAPVWRANYAFRAVEIPAGRHRVEFRYRPLSLYVGLALTIISLTAAVVLGVRCGRSL